MFVFAKWKRNDCGLGASFPYSKNIRQLYADFTLRTSCSPTLKKLTVFYVQN